jgi:3-oxoadipate enol-lactonase
VFVLESGPSSGHVVLLVHALGLDHSMWASQEAALRTEMRVLMPDLPGFGRSRLEESGLDRCVEACAERLAHSGVPATVAGVSYGAWVAAISSPGAT